MHTFTGPDGAAFDVEVFDSADTYIGLLRVRIMLCFQPSSSAPPRRGSVCFLSVAVWRTKKFPAFARVEVHHRVCLCVFVLVGTACPGLCCRWIFDFEAIKQLVAKPSFSIMSVHPTRTLT